MFLDKKNICIGLLICCVLLLCSCSNNTQQQIITSPLPQIDEPSRKSYDLMQLQPFGGEPWGGFSEDGFYYIDSNVRRNGSTNINYVDYQTLQSVRLCAQPNCTHDTTNCTGFIPLSPGGVCPMVVGETIVLFYQGNAREGPNREIEAQPRVEVMALNGSDRKEICCFAANQIPERPVLTDGSSLYLRITTYTEVKTIAELVRIDLTTGEYETLYQLNEAQNERIWGAYGNYIYLYRYSVPVESAFQIPDDARCELCRMDLVTGEKESIFQWDFHSSRPWLADNTLVWLDAQDGFYHKRDLLSGKELVLDQYTPGGPGSGLIDADADHILVREMRPSETNTVGYDILYYTVWNDGHVTPWNLVYDYEGDLEPIQRIHTAKGAYYLVMLDERFEQITSSALDGTNAYISASIIVYGLMNQDDYWNGIPHWKEITS